MRVPAGGPATINGIIYQMLWCLLETSSIRLQNLTTRTGDSDEFSRATLVLEPSQGGDASLLRAGVQRVVQLKARSDGSTWSLRELVHDVFPDLYGAVDLDQQQEFVFFTEGRRGDWGEVADFFARLANIPFPTSGQSVLSSLDSERTVRFRGTLLNPAEGGGTIISERDLFEQIVSVLRAGHSVIRNAPTDATRLNVWWLLSRMEFRWGETKERLHGLLLTRLHSMVDDPDTTQTMLLSMVAALQSRATTGDALVDADDFFAEHGLRGVPLIRRQWPRLLDDGAKLLERDLNRKFRYNAADDVRPGGDTLIAEPQVDLWRRGVEGADCLLLSGGSGQGKTWRLCALAHALAATDAPVAVVTADAGAREAAADAAHHFWSGVCHRRKTSMSLDQIAGHLRETGAVLPGATWLYVLVDGVQTPQEALFLYQRIGVVDGVRLAFTASERVADRLSVLPNAPTIVTLPVNDFTEKELRDYVTDGDAVRWHAIGDEAVRRVIRRPLLAWIYKTVAGEREWNARNEYELYDVYLRRHILERLQDAGIFTAESAFTRAGLALWDGEQYPWSQRQLSAFGFDNDLVVMLLASGFLIHGPDGRFSIWHSRIKEWLIAYALAEELGDGQRDVCTVGTRCHSLLFYDQWHEGSESEQVPNTRYVTMDLVWHLAYRAANSSAATDILDVIIQRLEGETDHFRLYESLYEGLLPTIGPAIVPALFRRLHVIGDTAKRGALTRCLAEFDADSVAPDAIRLLQNDDKELRRAGADILATCPAAAALPFLWQLYCGLRKECESWDPQRHADRSGTEGSEMSEPPFWDKEATRKAIAACSPLAPDWIEEQVRRLPVPGNTDNSVPVDSIIWMLVYAHDRGECWRACKELLRPWTVAPPADQAILCARAFAGAIYEWKDADEVSWLCERVKSDDGQLIGPMCLRALVRIAPDAAVEAIPDLAPGFFATTSHWVLRYLLARKADATREAMTRAITGDSEHRWVYAATFAKVPEALTETALGILLDDIHDAAKQDDSSAHTLWKALHAIESIADMPILRAFWKQSDQGWDVHLTRLLIDKGLMPSHHHNFVLQTATNVLMKSGGQGFTSVLNHWLQSEGPYARLEGILTAHLRPDVKTINLLGRLAIKPGTATEEADDKPEDLMWHSRLAQKTLGRSGAWKTLISSVVFRAENTHRDVINSRVGEPPLTDADMSPAFAVLETDPKHPGAIIALGVGQRTDRISHIVAVLNAEDVCIDNKVTNACQYALTVMPSLSPEAIDILTRRLPYTETGWLLRPALMNNGSASALAALVRYAKTGLYQFNDGQPNWIKEVGEVAVAIRFLLRQVAVQDEVAALCRERFSVHDTLDSTAQQMVTAIASLAAKHPAARVALDCQPAQDFIRLRVFEPDNAICHVGEKARLMRGLAAYDPADAYAAMIRALWNKDVHDREYVPYMLLELAQKRALPDLFAFLASDKAKLRMRHHVALALSESATSEGTNKVFTVQNFLLDKARSSEARERRAACRALGFLAPSDDVVGAVRVLMDDDVADIFEDACVAWQRLESSRRVDELVEAFLTENDVSLRWIILETALEIGDMGDVHRAFPEWLQRMAERLPPLDCEYITDKANKIREKRDRDLRYAEDREDHLR